jgi:hypothetical protein
MHLIDIALIERLIKFRYGPDADWREILDPACVKHAETKIVASEFGDYERDGLMVDGDELMEFLNLAR